MENVGSSSQQGAEIEILTIFTAGPNMKQTTFLRGQSVSGVKMLISTYVPPAHCKTHEGTQIAQMSILNKLDYAHWNNYMFRLETTTADPSLAPRGSPDVSYFSYSA